MGKAYTMGTEKAVNSRNQNYLEKPTRRAANFELLRLIAMLMVVSLHYLSKGQVLPTFEDVMPTANQYLAYALEALSIVAVNAFVMLSGYFLCTAEFKAERVVQLWCQVVFYTVGITLIMLITGVLPIADRNLYTILQDIFPIQTEHYWFATSYILLYLFTPLLNRAIRQLGQKQMQILIALLLLVFSIPKSILPIPLKTDRAGYDVVWFICVYLIAAYIRLYGIPFFKSLQVSVLTYLFCTILIYLYSIGMGTFSLYTGRLQNQVQEMLQYNHIVTLLAAIAFFYIFYYVKIESDTLACAICKISPYAFGVYLLHEQLNIRYEWPIWFKVQEISSTGWFLLHYVVVIVGIFVLGIAVDFIRACMFNVISAYLKKGRMASGLRRIDELMQRKTE